ncbi:MAG: hypothetical protein AAFV29_22665, partial [Myxococcota bacterium]
MATTGVSTFGQQGCMQGRAELGLGKVGKGAAGKSTVVAKQPLDGIEMGAVGLLTAPMVMTTATCAGTRPSSAFAEDPPRAQWQRLNDIYHALGVTSGDRLADISAGEGFLSLRLSPLVGASGRVYAVDTQKSSIELMMSKGRAMGLDNIDLILGTQTDPRLPYQVLDGVV